MHMVAIYLAFNEVCIIYLQGNYSGFVDVAHDAHRQCEQTGR